MIKKENKNAIIAGIIVLSLLALFGKLVIYDGIIGIKLYDKNDIIIRYHRYVNIFTAKNNSDESIYMHYQYGRCRRDANLDEYHFDIKYYKKSDDFEIESGEKYIKFMGFMDDAYLFTVANDSGVYDSVSYNKHDWFRKY